VQSFVVTFPRVQVMPVEVTRELDDDEFTIHML